MDQVKIKNDLLLFLEEYNFDERSSYWHEKSKLFLDFWENKILNDDHGLTIRDVNSILKIIDDRAKGHQPGEESIGRVGIYQNLWHKAFYDIKNIPKLRQALDNVLSAEDDEDLAYLVNEFLAINAKRGNGLSGEGANMLNCFLFLKDPDRFLSVLTLKHRRLIADYFELGDIDSYKTPGDKIIRSNYLITNNFNDKFGSNICPRPLSEFFYTPFDHYATNIKPLWYKKEYISKQKDLIGVPNKNDSYQDNYVGIEGKMIPRVHSERERDSKIIKVAKQRRVSMCGRLDCDICGFNFKDKYGERGADIIEGHHIKPVSQMGENEITKVEDIALICSNCHRIIHSKSQILTIDEVKELLKA